MATARKIGATVAAGVMHNCEAAENERPHRRGRRQGRKIRQTGYLFVAAAVLATLPALTTVLPAVLAALVLTALPALLTAAAGFLLLLARLVAAALLLARLRVVRVLLVHHRLLWTCGGTPRRPQRQKMKERSCGTRHNE